MKMGVAGTFFEPHLWNSGNLLLFLADVQIILVSLFEFFEPSSPGVQSFLNQHIWKLNWNYSIPKTAIIQGPMRLYSRGKKDTYPYNICTIKMVPLFESKTYHYIAESLIFSIKHFWWGSRPVRVTYWQKY